MISGALFAALPSALRAAPLSGASAVPLFTGYVGDYFPFDPPQRLPAFSFEDSSGGSRDLAAMAGRVVLLNLWATWCAPCVLEMPALDRLQAAFAKSDFTVLALCGDVKSARTVADFFAARALRHLDLYIDPGETALQACAVPALPTSFIIDRNGWARGMLPGGAAWDTPEAKALIRYYLTNAQSVAKDARRSG